eukprot:Pgem_evm1s18870
MSYHNAVFEKLGFQGNIAPTSTSDYIIMKNLSLKVNLEEGRIMLIKNKALHDDPLMSMYYLSMFDNISEIILNNLPFSLPRFLLDLIVLEK